MKLKLVVFGLFLFSFWNAQIMWQVKKDTVIKWYYYDGDEFNGPGVDEEKWIPAYSWTKLNYDFDYLMMPERIEFDNGVARFMCYRDTGLYEVPAWQCDSAFVKKYRASLVERNKFRYHFTAGNVWSRMQYGKGYFEMRFKSTDSYGMWPAFWLYGNNKDEIDFFELKGEKSKEIHIDVHCLKGCESGYRGGSFFPKSFGGWIKTTNTLKDGYNILAGEWQDGYVKWYLNGEGIGYYKGEFGSQQMNLIIGTGPSLDGKAFEPGVNASSVFPNSLDVDYVRVWYRENKPKNEVPGKKHNVFDYAKTGGEENKTFLKRKINYMYNKKDFRKDILTVSALPKRDKKLILTSVGKTVNYSVTFYEPTGKELLSKNIQELFNEFDFSTLTKSETIVMKIQASGKSIEETIGLR